MQQGSKLEAPKLEVKEESDNTALSGYRLNLRLDAELKKLTNDQISIHSAEIEAIWDTTLKPWRSGERTVSQIKSMAEEIVRGLSNAMPSNVIYPSSI